MPRSVLITGASGYLGSQLVLALQDQPVEKIVALDIRPRPAAFGERVTYVQSDIRAPSLADWMKGQAVEVVVHLASIVTPGKDSNREFEYAVDVLGTKHVLEACITAGVRKLIVTSSGAAYGYHADNPAWLDESDALRGNEEFAYSHHKRLVEEMLADYRRDHPQLQQLIFRPGTILGKTVANQITALFDKKGVMGIGGSDSPFVIIWDQDVVACLVQGIFSDKTGIFNLAGDGALSLKEIAGLLGKPYLPIPPGLLKGALGILKKLQLTQYGPEQIRFLQYRPVLSNRRLKEEFGYTPRKTSKEAFLYYLQEKVGP